ncbi:Transcription initiation factor TFIID subunit 2 [Fulvia fulva]|uniref:Transcription initiation factor TFIID subunit 2 n=1 Tax=Passalora fulva TaxID=5499 RepID=A0A9Q8LC93_PASFU|nr:Transcription initiation factor TFIID subunit 2 [Fulvia fulva]KAK4629039.1 Transcription initiation factor TFIID subunit 2 [Fulvia fulva]KAK4630516.1 Transcription initiation factor TFIID subunit 2 [Fulvia fulva]UJO14797.1 Transcription initiation factor TFIID subunit 2 [Fulvia fulva]WPV12520.1 Transcription initiation factor TFIID subunit 2 [Fulvia fulva]WPV27630.1 Transcription initiation factor TFIID subunit 2 [Fulvia fulva]
MAQASESRLPTPARDTTARPAHFYQLDARIWRIDRAMAPQIPLDQIPTLRPYDIVKQRVDLDVDFPARSLKGSTEITVQPTSKELRTIQLQCRQAKVTQVQVGGITAKWDYDDPYRAHVSAKSTVHQHAMLKGKVEHSMKPAPQPELYVTLPPKLKIQELQGDSAAAVQQESEVAETPILEKAQQLGPTFAPIKLTVEFEVESSRDGVHWIGCEETDKRYPHLYTKLEPWAGNTSSIFPCVDDATTRAQWEIAIRCPRTLGDAFRRPKTGQVLENGDGVAATNGDVEMVNGTDAPAKTDNTPMADEFLIDLSEEDAALELAILCVGSLLEDVADSYDDSRHTVTYSLNDAVCARHVGFAIGPFESVDLTSTRTADEEEKLAATAVKVEAFCLPGRTDEVQNTCFPICQAVDHLSVHCGRFPFSSYQMLFVDDAIHDTSAAAGLSICSTRLLFPEEIIEPIDRNTRILVRAVADQWSGVNIIPREPTDAWAVAGIAGYLTDVFMKKLSGNNQYRWEQKLASEKVYDLDVDRPSIQDHGYLLHLDPSIREFLDLKSTLVLGILDRRLIKSSGSTGVMRIINKIFLNAKTGTLHNGALSTAEFQRTCEKLGHNKLEQFFRQWVIGAGCPIFYVTQKFNKKKLVVEMDIRQRQADRQTKPLFAPNNFMREVKEHVGDVYAGALQPVFTGPMTIRIHEADGTPYEHIVEIKETVTKLEIPYNTKYKRLKRSRRQRERAAAEGQAGENADEALLYCLGDVLDRPEDMAEWNLMDWSKEDEDKMRGESYEWIRMDADFEWLGRIHLVQPLYMYISQLQQDRDVVAQWESMRQLVGAPPHHVSLSILLRTLMDERYFYGIRVMAAEGLAMLARNQVLEIGQTHLMKAFAEMFCEEDGVMPRPNDFTSRVAFIMQCAIPRAMSKLRNDEGKVPKAVEQFFVDKLKFNDNSDNPYSDCHYVSTLMSCLADSLVVSHRIIKPPAAPTYEFSFSEEEPPEEEEQEEINPDADFEQMAIDEIERYRRLDEWVVTHQNIYSTTAIQCLQKLTKAGIVKDKTKELLQYTRSSTADNVRLEAFRCLNEIGLTRRMPVMKHLIYNLVEDRSPYVRARLTILLGEALGHIALGDDPVEKTEAAPPPADGLIVEEGASNEAKRIEATRKTTTEGALAALKVTLQDSEVFKQALWYAATSPVISLDEIAGFCDIAALIYEAVTSLTVMMKLPRPYKCVREGKGKVRFYQEGPYRTKPVKGLPFEDYQSLEVHGLKYSGPLGEDTKRAIAKKADDAAAAQALKTRINTAAQQMAAAQAQAAVVSMPPPPTIPTPSTEKSGIRLSLGGPKRKPSVDIREASPKAIKIFNASTPGSAPSRKPSAAGKSRPVVLSLGISASRKAQQIVTSPATPGRYPSGMTVPSRAITPQSSQILQQPTSLSPQASFSATTPTPPAAPLNLNVGGFRSFDSAAANPFGPSPDVISPAPASSFAGSPPPRSSVTSLTGGGITSLTSLSAKSASPPAVTQPPKPKLKLKFGASRQNSVSGPQGSPPG